MMKNMGRPGYEARDDELEFQSKYMHGLHSQQIRITVEPMRHPKSSLDNIFNNYSLF